MINITRYNRNQNPVTLDQVYRLMNQGWSAKKKTGELHTTRRGSDFIRNKRGAS